MSLDLTAVAERYAAYRRSHDHPGAFACCTAHATADAVPELIALIRRLQDEVELRARNEARLMNALDAVEWLTKDTDGGDIDGDANIPIGEVRRVLAEAVAR